MNSSAGMVMHSNWIENLGIRITWNPLCPPKEKCPPTPLKNPNTCFSSQIKCCTVLDFNFLVSNIRLLKLHLWCHTGVGKEKLGSWWHTVTLLHGYQYTCWGWYWKAATNDKPTGIEQLLPCQLGKCNKCLLGCPGQQTFRYDKLWESYQRAPF